LFLKKANVTEKKSKCATRSDKGKKRPKVADISSRSQSFDKSGVLSQSYFCAISTTSESKGEPVKEVYQPHDKFFKELMSRKESAEDFLRYYLPPEIVNKLDLSTLSISKDSFVDKELGEHFSDILYQINLRDGQQAKVYVLIDHKSSPDGLVAFQLLRYMVRAWEYSLKQQKAERKKEKEKAQCEGKKRRRHQKLTLTPILPVVFYHGEREWAVSKTLDTLFGNMPQELTSFVPNYQYFLCDVTKINDEDIKGEPFLQAGLMLLKYIFRQDLSDKLLEIYSPLKEVEEQQKRRDFVETTLYYLSSAARQLRTDKLEKAVTEALSEGGALMATLVERWLEQGRQEVRQEEKRNGLLLGIQMGLDIKFGDEGLRLYQEIQKIQEMDILQAICDKIKPVSALGELRRIYQ
jgi:hypothetical protein